MDKKITLRHLEAFRALMLRRTVTGAAEMLEVTQPVVTRLISDLEERIEITLFTRSGGRLEPTNEAGLLLHDVNLSLSAVERVTHAASNIRTLKGGKLEIAAAPSMALSFLPLAIAAFRRAHPDATVSLQMHSSPTVLDMVQSGGCDLGFTMLPVRATRHGTSENLVSAKLVGVVPADHRLANHAVLQPEDFEGEDFISLGSLMEVRNKLDSLMLAHGVTRRSYVETPISSAVIKLVEAGAGISIIDPLTAYGYTGTLVRFIPFGPELVRDYSYVISPRSSSNMIIKPFLEHARREIRSMVPAHLLVES